MKRTITFFTEKKDPLSYKSPDYIAALGIAAYGVLWLHGYTASSRFAFVKVTDIPMHQVPDVVRHHSQRACKQLRRGGWRRRIQEWFVGTTHLIDHQTIGQ